MVGLTPNGFRLGLNAAHSAVNHHRAVQHTHGTFDFNREVDVPRGVDDVETVRLVLHVHAAPEAGRSGGRNRDTTFLFLFHPVHRGSAVVDFTELMVDAREEQNTFGRRGLARVNVGRNTDIAVARNRSSTSHDLFTLIRVMTRERRPKGFSRIGLSELEAEMREGLVGFSHTMHFVTLLHSTAAAFRSFQQLTSQALGHRLFGTGFRAFTQPAHCQSQTADRTDLNRHLVVRTADTAALHFHERTDVVEGGREHFKSVLAGLFFNVLQSTVDDAFSDGLLARRA